MKRILSIDGGGIKGVFPAAFLATLEEDLPCAIGQYFDLIVGTSTGGIIALGLGAGFSAGELLGFYEKYGPEIFQRQGCLARIGHYFRGKHRAEPLREALESRFRQLRIGDSKTRLVIPAQNLETGHVNVFKTAHHPRFTMDYKKSMVEAAMATSAAPTYFPVHMTSNGTAGIDGGLWANNPAGIAAVEAVGVLGWKPDEIRCLSLSCTVAPPTTNAAHKWHQGKLYWAQKLMEVVGAGQSSGAMGTARLLLGRDNVIRIAPVVAPGVFELDGIGAIGRLKGLGNAEAREAKPRLAQFFESPAEVFVPCYSVTG